MCTTLDQSFPLRIFRGGGEISEQKIMVTEGMAMVPKVLHLSSTAGTEIISPFLPMSPCSCLPCGISVGEKQIISGYDCVLPHVYGQTSLW